MGPRRGGGVGRAAALRPLAAITLGTLAVPLDTAVNIAFPAITRHFALDLPEIQWVVICYVLTYGSLMLGIGRLGDILGHRLVFRAGLLWSGLACLLCALAPDYAWLLGFRVLQGVGAALVIGCGPALVTGLAPEAMRGRMLGLYGLVFAAGSALGPSLGGVLVQAWGWEAVFWFRAPVALAALALLPRGAGAGGAPARGRAAREPFDLPGAALLALGLSSLLLAANRARGLAEGDITAIPLGAVALFALAGFPWWARRSPRPVLDPALFRLPGFALANLANVAVNLAAFAVLLFVPYWLTGIAGLGTGIAGLVLGSGFVGAMLASPLGGWALARVPPGRVALAGAALTAAGLVLIGGWEEGTGVPAMALALLVQGVGLGLFGVAYTDIVTGTMPRADRGVAGSLAMVTRTLGLVAAASALTLLFQGLEAAALAGGAAAGEAFRAAFRQVFLLAASLPALVLVAAPLRRGRRRG